MVRLTQSLKKWLFDNHKEIIPSLLFGHVELFTKEMQKEYLEWCQTEEGRKYLNNGSEYKSEED